MKSHFIVFLLLIGIFAHGQDMILTNYTMRNGLPSNEVHSIYQDNKGKIWFATDRGLSCFNGEAFSTVHPKNGVFNSIVLNFYEENSNKVWISTLDNKLFLFNPNRFPFHFWSFTYNDTLSEAIKESDEVYNIRSIWRDENEAFNFGFRRGGGKVVMDKKGNWYWDGKPKLSSFQRYRHQDFYIHFNSNTPCAYTRSVLDSLSGGDVFIINDVNGQTDTLDEKITYHSRLEGGITDYQLWNNKLYFIFGQYFFIAGEDILLSYKLRTEGVRMHVDSSGIYVVDRLGLAQFDLDFNFKASFLKNKFCTDIFKDKTGGLWVSTIDNGIYYVKSPEVKVYGNEALKNQAYGYLKVNESSILVYNRANHLLEINKKGEVLHSYKKKIFEKTPTEIMNSIIMKKSGTAEEHEEEAYIFSNLKPNSDTTLFHSAMNKRISIYKRENQEFEYVLRKELDIPHMNDGAIVNDQLMYLATERGLYAFKNYKELEYIPVRGKKQYRMSHISPFRSGYVIGTKMNGLLFFDNNRFYTFNTRHGLLSNNVSLLHIKNENEVYLGHTTALIKLKLEKI